MSILKLIRPTNLVFLNQKAEVNHAHTYIFTADEKIDWRAGQHGMIELKLENGKTSRRMFSISSAPAEKEIHITTYWCGNEASDFKKALHNLRPGDKAKLIGPVGPLYVRNYSTNNVFIAGGIGITPFRSILAQAITSDHDLHATLLYTNKNNDFIFKKELDDYEKQLPNLKIYYIAHPDQISKQAFDSFADNNSTFFASGPPKMIKDVKQKIKHKNKSAKIYTDPFIGYKSYCRHEIS